MGFFFNVLLQLSGVQVAKLDFHEGPIRDCSWHPFYPSLVSSSWDGVIVNWEFPGGTIKPVPVRRSSRRRGYPSFELLAAQRS